MNDDGAEEYLQSDPTYSVLNTRLIFNLWRK